MSDTLGFQKLDNGTKVQIQNAIANVAQSQTDTVLIAAVPTKRIVVLGIFAHLAGTVETNVTFNSKPSGAGSAISPLAQVAANGGYVIQRGCPSDFLFQTKRGEGLAVTTGGGSTVGFNVLYCLIG